MHAGSAANCPPKRSGRGLPAAAVIPSAWSASRAPPTGKAWPTSGKAASDLNTRDDGFAERAPVGCFADQAAPRADAGALPMVIKGESFLCAADYCVRYRAAARHPQEADPGAAHFGFRTVSRRL